MKKLFGKWAVLLLVLLLNEGGLMACGLATVTTTVPPSATPAPAELTVWGWSSGLKGLKANWVAFSQANPGTKLNLVEMSQAELYDKLNTGLLAGGLGLPDIVQVSTERLDFFINRFPEGFVDLKSWASKYEGQYIGLQWSDVQRIGRIRALPWEIQPVALFYRADLFQKAGIDLSTVQTWDDFAKLAPSFKASNPQLRLMAFDQTEDTLLRVLLYQQGASYFTPDGKINLASPEAVRALALIKQMYQQGALQTVPPQSSLLAVLQASGAASFVGGADWVSRLSQANPPLPGQWEVAPLPLPGPNNERWVNLGGSYLALLRTGKHQEAAAAFVEYCLASKEHQNLMLQQAWLLPSFLPAYDDPLYTKALPFFNNQPLWQFFASGARQLKMAYFTQDFEPATEAAITAQLLALVRLEPAQALLKKANDLKDLTAREILKPLT